MVGHKMQRAIEADASAEKVDVFYLLQSVYGQM
jgi:hypothetical protein